VRLGLDVGREALRAVVDAGHARCVRVPGAGMKPDDSAVDPAGRASRSSTTQSMPASRQHQRGQPARTGADDGHRHVHFGLDRRGATNGSHRLRHAIESMKGWHAVTSATLRMSASEVLWRSSPKAAQPSPSTSVR
jgi:hypothetical protein